MMYNEKLLMILICATLIMNTLFYVFGGVPMDKLFIGSSFMFSAVLVIGWIIKK
jgi:hypothetical protein